MELLQHIIQMIPDGKNLSICFLNNMYTGNQIREGILAVQICRHCRCGIQCYDNVGDTGLTAITENYDGRGELWKVVLSNSLYEYDTQAYIRRSQMYHDLRAGAYIAERLINDSKPFVFEIQFGQIDNFAIAIDGPVSINAIPEPSNVLYLIVGALGIFVARRRIS